MNDDIESSRACRERTVAVRWKKGGLRSVVESLVRREPKHLDIYRCR